MRETSGAGDVRVRLHGSRSERRRGNGIHRFAVTPARGRVTLREQRDGLVVAAAAADATAHANESGSPWTRYYGSFRAQFVRVATGGSIVTVRKFIVPPSAPSLRLRVVFVSFRVVMRVYL